MQIKIAELEDRTQVPFNSRFPFWWLLQFYYLKSYVNQFLEHYGKSTVKDESGEKRRLERLSFPSELPLWERKGLLSLLAWTATNSYKCPEDVLDYPLDFYTDSVSCRLRGDPPLSLEEWEAQRATPIATCFCGRLIDETLDVLSEEVEWIGCDWCSRWCHLSCALKASGLPPSSPPPSTYYCPSCAPNVPSTPPPCMLPSPLFVMQRTADNKKAQQLGMAPPMRPKFTLSQPGGNGLLKRPLSIDENTESVVQPEKRLKTNHNEHVDS